MSYITEILKILPQWLLPVIVFFAMFVLYELAKTKWLVPKQNGSGAIKELQIEIENHLTTKIDELITVTRNQTEELNRNVKTMNVILTKMDSMRDIMIKIEGKVGA